MPHAVTLPVNVTFTSSESISIFGILELLFEKPPSGTPHLFFSISIPHPIVALAGFSTIVLPTIMEGAANLNACQ